MNELYTPEPWERQVNESWKDYEYFSKYRDALPVDRRWYKLAKVCNCALSTLKRIAHANNWEKRLALYYQYLDREKQEMATVERERMYERQINLSLQMQDLVEAALDDIDPATLSPNDIAKWLDLSTKIELRARGEPTEKVEEKKSITVNQQNNAVGVILNDKASRIACDILEQLAISPNDPSRIRVVHNTGKVDVSETSSPPKSETGGSSSGSN